jgi:hypothetical protein
MIGASIRRHVVILTLTIAAMITVTADCRFDLNQQL